MGDGGDENSNAHPAMSQKDVVLTLNFVADAGQLMLESSTSVSEVQSRLRRFLDEIGLGRCSLDADYSSLVLSWWKADLDVPITTMRSVTVGSPRVGRLAAASRLLDRVEAGDVSVEDALAELETIRDAPEQRAVLTRLALLLSVVGWVVFLGGGDLYTLATALVASIATIPIGAFVRWTRLGDLAGTFLNATIIAALPNIAAAAGVPLDVGPAVVGALFIYLPGRALVSSVVDGLNNAPLSSLARGLQALVTAGVLAVGMLLGSGIGAGLGLDFSVQTGAVPAPFAVAGAALGVLGIAVAWATPRNQLLPAVAIGAGGWLLVELITPLVGGRQWIPYMLAATIVGVLGALVARLQKASATVYTGVAILPLVPGFTLYQGMLGLAEGRSDDAYAALATATIVSIAVAIGVATGLALGGDAVRIGRRARRATRRG